MFVPGNLSYVFHVYIQDQCVNCFENNTMKLSINEAKLTGLWARNCAAIKQVSNLKFAFGPEKLPEISKNGPLDRTRETAEIEPSVYTVAAKYRGQRISSLQITEIDGFEEEPSSPTGDDSLMGDSNPR